MTYFNFSDMKAIALDGIAPDFLHAFLHFHKIPIEHLNLLRVRQKNVITNQSLITLIRFNFENFQNSNKTLDQFFDRQIVKVNLQANKETSMLKTVELINVPLFIIVNYNKHLVYGETRIISKKPIKMPLDKLRVFLNISETDLTFENCPRNIDMFKVEKGVCFTDFSTPGSSNTDIAIGFDGSDYYWIPDKSIIEKRYFCTKFPNQCNVYFKTQQHLNRHMDTCEVETKIISKQVRRF